MYYYSLMQEVLELLNSCQLQLKVQLQTRHHLKPAADRELGEGLGQIGQTFSNLQMTSFINVILHEKLITGLFVSLYFSEFIATHIF